jgi:hypothetical protein
MVRAFRLELQNGKYRFAPQDKQAALPNAGR